MKSSAYLASTCHCPPTEMCCAPSAETPVWCASDPKPSVLIHNTFSQYYEAPN